MAQIGSGHLGPSRPGSARLGLSWPGSARLRSALLRHWPAQARVLIANIIKNNQKQMLLQNLRRRKIQTTEAENSGVGLARLHLGSLRLSSTRPGLRLGSAWLGSVWHLTLRIGSVPRGWAKLGPYRLGSARLGSGSPRLRFACPCSAWPHPTISIFRGITDVPY